MILRYLIIFLLLSSTIISQTLESCDDVSCICAINERQEVICNNCRNGYTMDQSNNTCQITHIQEQSDKEIISHCILYNEDICYECIEGYTLQDGQCLFFCIFNNQYIPNHNDCKTTLINNKCLEYKGKSGNLCTKCGNQTYLQGQECVQSCDQQTTPSENGICFCKNNGYYLGNNCFLECPPYYTPNNQLKICERWCILKYFPLIDQKENSVTCKKVDSSQNQFCADHLKYLPKLINYRQIQNEGDEIIFSLELIQTPIVCYKIALKGKGDYYLYNSFNYEFVDRIQIVFLLDKKDLLNNQQSIQCDNIYCYLDLKIKYQGVNSYSQKVKIKINQT